MKLVMSHSPHVKGPFDSAKVMWFVIIALLPAAVASVLFFGQQALVRILFAIAVALLTEGVIQAFMFKKPNTIFDGSAALTGLLLAFNVPSNVPLFHLAVGTLVAVGIGKMAFGGLGKNPFNPALVGRAFMLVSYPVAMTTWPKPGESTPILDMLFKKGGEAVDVVTAATPLGILKEGVHSGAKIADLNLPSYGDLFIGNIGGCIGETSALALLIGGLLLMATRIISWHIPVMFLGGLAAITGVFYLIEPTTHATPLFHLLTGGAMLGAFFMATDFVTSPMTNKGRVIFALSGGLLCGLIRLFGSYPEGCSYAILIMNGFVPIIDKYIKPHRFGT